MTRHWKSLPLRLKVLAAMIVGGVLAVSIVQLRVARDIRDKILLDEMASTAMYVESFLTPKLQDLASSAALSREQRQAVDQLLSSARMGRPLISLRIWKDDTIIYSDRPELIGRSFPLTRARERAAVGHVDGNLNNLVDADNDVERATGLPILEIYAPIRKAGSARVIGVAETYENAEAIQARIWREQLKSSLPIVVFAGGLLGWLYMVVRAAEMAMQRHADMTRRTTQSDIHDGPLQLLSLAAMRLSVLSRQTPAVAGNNAVRAEIDIIKGFVTESIGELRQIVADPAARQAQLLSFSQGLEHFTGLHEQRTGTPVERSIPAFDVSLPVEEREALYRFVQEALTNSYRHAGGAGQRVAVSLDWNFVAVEVSDRGNGIGDAVALPGASDGHGLKGMRRRIEGLGGALTIASGRGNGTVLTATFKTRAEGLSRWFA